jgi:hypothetical protein
VRDEKTGARVIATAMKLAKTIGKVPVLSRVCDGFVANRLMTDDSCAGSITSVPRRGNSGLELSHIAMAGNHRDKQ